MSPEKQGLASDPKKKATIVVVVIVLALIAWQVKGLFGEDTPAPAKVAHAPAAMPQTAGAQGMPPAGANSAPGANGAAAAAQPVDQTPKQVLVQANMELMKLQKETEAKYIAALNELQMLKLQREIAEVNQSIAKAKLDTIGTEKSITDMLTVKPAAAPVPDSDYTKMMTEGTDSTSIKPPLGANAGPDGKAIPVSSVDSTGAPGGASYTVLSVSKQNQKWSAVLGANGKLFNVSVGDVISLDNSVVTSINRDGVVLDQKGVKTKVSISSTL